MADKIRLLICGDRNWNSPEIIRQTLASLFDLSLIECVIEGECRGADLQARAVCESLGIPILYSAPGIPGFPAPWEKYGKRAGIIRNRQMLDEGKPNVVLAFHSDFKNSTGTKNMLAIASKAGILCYLHDGTSWSIVANAKCNARLDIF